jgi:STAS-like domain of unknown function (DUF4325)
MRKPTMTLDIANSFSKEPAGRFRTDGSSSGEVFREDHLIPALTVAEVVEVNLDGTEGYGSSFLEEAFGGLLRRLEMSEDEFRTRIHLKSDDDPSLITEVLGYVGDESRRKAALRPPKGS